MFQILVKNKKHIAEDEIKAGEKTYKVFIYLEYRKNCTASIGKKGIHIRLSRYISEKEKQKQYSQLKDWAHQYILENKIHEKKPFARKYQDGDVFKIQNQEYLIRIQYQSRVASKGSLKNNVMILTLSSGMKEKEEQKHKSYLVSKLIGNVYQPMIAKRMETLNALHFKMPVKKVRMRYNVSNWGSCSYDGNISISTGLLFAPSEVIDYIIIHELAHLIEHNHSDKYWSHVEKAMPGYKYCEQWLTENGKYCIF